MVVPDDARCIGCHYSLRDNVTGRCPECGRAFDPHDLMTISRPGDGWQRRVKPALKATRTALGWILLATVATALILVMDFRRVSAFWNWGAIIAIPISFLLGWGLWIFILQRLARASQWPAWARILACAILLLIPVSGSIAWGRCPHAHYVVIGPWIGKFAVGGRACNNPQVVKTIWDRMLGLPGLRERY